MTETNPPIVLYDGKCNFCNAIVNFVIRNDKNKRFLFAPIQSREARKILREHNESIACLHTVYLVEDGDAKKRSKAIFRIFSLLGLPYSILAVFRFLPLFITDGVYKFISKYRYRWFGEADEVIVPDEKIKDRFITKFKV